MSLIKLTDVTLGYDDEVVHTGISFSVEKGDYLCILGANGTGKSTLMKAILNLNKPLSGSIEYEKGFYAKSIGYLPQQSKAQKLFPASVEEVVLSGTLNQLGNRPFYSKKEKEIRDKNLKRFNIENIRKRSYQELSGGQQQRVLLARALSATQTLLLLDEPVAGLDIHSASELYALIESLNKEQNITIIMVTHDIHPALNSANKILYLDQTSSYFGLKEEFFSSPKGRVYLEESGHHD